MRQRGRLLARTIVLTVIGVVFGLSVTMCLQALRTFSLKNKHSCAYLKSELSTDGENFSGDAVDRRQAASPDADSRRNDNEGRLGSHPPRDLLFVGVMTAQKYVDTRGYGIYSTWAQNLIANGSLAFFVSSVTESRLDGVQMPLIRLPNVDDSYPPQKKSFSMLKYFYDNYLDQYEWFLRADDDVYLRLDKLEVFLRSLNSSQPLFLGQTGLGTPEEYGQLSLGQGENYCMGGPGMLFSRETLRRIGPNLDECLRSTITTHEDVEVGRCVKRFAGVTCAWSYEMQSLFYNNQSGVMAFTGDLNLPEVHHAMTLHPVKRQTIMRKLHGFIRGLKLSDLRFRTLQLSRDVLTSLRELESNAIPIAPDELAKVSEYALSPSMTKFVPSNLDELLAWEFLSPNIAFCFGAPNCPRHNIESYWRYSIANVIRQVMDIVNKYARQRGRILEYQEVLYGYRRVDPLHGAEYILDLLLLYKKFKGRHLTIPVRRHAYLQQSFGRLQLIEEESWRRLQARQSNAADLTTPLFRTDTADVHIILPLSGRSSTFQRFVDLLEQTCLKTGEILKLYIVLYSVNNTEDMTIRESIRRLQYAYAGLYDIRLFHLNGEFSRGAALSFGASQCPSDALLFFTDVDVVFSRDFLHRLRQNTIRGRTVYFPIVFSQYASSKFKWPSPDIDIRINYTSENGYFRHFGYGLLGVYKSDFESISGFDLNIRGWGMEDVNLFDKFVKKSALTIFRAPEPDLVHIYHPILCDSHLPSDQLEMCRGSKAESLASVHALSDAFFGTGQFFSLFVNGTDQVSKMKVAKSLEQFL